MEANPDPVQGNIAIVLQYIQRFYTSSLFLHHEPQYQCRKKALSEGRAFHISQLLEIVMAFKTLAAPMRLPRTWRANPVAHEPREQAQVRRTPGL